MGFKNVSSEVLGKQELSALHQYRGKLCEVPGYKAKNHVFEGYELDFFYSGH